MWVRVYTKVYIYNNDISARESFASAHDQL